ncbi:MAG: sigma-70 family RNA polymerase sigma factor [Pseudomonadota bacterium]|nr:sigma-70 family RNA polymerase sigma factor [Pseudomonadota bacterium]
MPPDQTSLETSILAKTLERDAARLLRFLIARTRDEDLSQDLMQQARLKLIEKPPEGEITDPLSYLYRLLENMVRDHRRSEQSREQRGREWGDRGEGVAPLRADPTTPERNALDRDYLDRVLAALDTLPERTKAIFIAYRVEGESQKDIASREGISLSAVEKHLQRAYRLVSDIRKKLSAGIGE